VRLGGEIAQAQGVHRALQTNLQLAHVAVGQGEHTDACEAQPLVEPGDIFLVAGRPARPVRGGWLGAARPVMASVGLPTC
jgi:hypothetical protein